MQNSIFNPQDAQPASSRKKRWLSYALVFSLISASAAVMMLCPCDIVGIHDYKAISSLVALAALFAIAAAFVVYRRMSRNSGIT